jgi:hypothetical protein
MPADPPVLLLELLMPSFADSLSLHPLMPAAVITLSSRQ